MADQPGPPRLARNTSVRQSILRFEAKLKEQYVNRKDTKRENKQNETSKVGIKQNNLAQLNTNDDEYENSETRFSIHRSTELEILDEETEKPSPPINFPGKRSSNRTESFIKEKQEINVRDPTITDFTGKRSEEKQDKDNDVMFTVPKKSTSKVPEELTKTYEASNKSKLRESDKDLENRENDEETLERNKFLPKRSVSKMSEELLIQKQNLGKRSTLKNVKTSDTNFMRNPNFEDDQSQEDSSEDEIDGEDKQGRRPVKNKIKDFEQHNVEKKTALEKQPSKKMPSRSFHNSLSNRTLRNSKVYRKRSGMASRGKEYELFSICHYALRLAIDKSVIDFQISSNNANFGTFDSLVLEAQTTTRIIEKFAFQLKHITNSNSIKFEDTNEEFNLQKWFEASKEIEKEDFNFVVLTNKIIEVGEEEFRLNLNGESLYVKILKTTLPLVLEKCGLEDCCYKFCIVKEKTTVSLAKVLLEYSNFFQKFFLCCKQKNLDELKKSLPEYFEKSFTCNVVAPEKYIQFIFQWNALEGTKEKLSKSLIQQVVTLHVLDPLIKPISFGLESDNAKILQKTISKFDVTVCDKHFTSEVTEIFGDAKTKLASEDVAAINRKYQITRDNISAVEDLSDEECTKFLWAIGKCPLIVEEHPAIYKAMELLKVGKFIMLGQHNLPAKCSVFQKLSDLNHHEDLYNKIIDNFCCFLAGKKVPLRELIYENASFGDIISTNELVKMISGPYNLQIEKMDLPEPYIYRRVSRNVIDFKFLERVDRDTFVLVSNATNRKEVEKHTKQGCNTSLDQTGGNFNVWIVEKECSQEDFDRLCQNNFSKRFHHLGIVEGRLEWFKSIGDLSDLEPYRIDAFVEDIRYIKLQNNINIIVDQAGIGKSVLLKELKNLFDDKLWTVFLSSTDIAAFCQNESYSTSKFEKFLLDTKYSSMKKFDRMLLKRLLTSGSVFYIWDGLDEISAKNFDFITEFIRSLSKNKSVHFLACRPHLKAKIEEKFSVMSRIVDPFDDADIDFFIEESLRKFFPKNYETAKHELKRIMSEVQLGDFLKVPIQLFMLIELFVQNFQNNETLLNELFSVTDLYKYFVEKKLKQSYKRTNSTCENDYGFMKEQIEHYQEAALITMFGEDVLTKLNVDSKKFLERIRNKKDVFGFVSYVDGHPQFYHYSYADYFVATYFKEHHARIPDFTTILFDAQYTNVRFFFDILLAEKSLPHLAVLYKNIDVLRKCQNLEALDAGGRNVLHLICSWGERYSMLKVEHLGDMYELDDTQNLAVKGESVKYKEILKFLLEKLDVNKKDEIFNMDAFEYARMNKSIFAVLSIVEKHNKNYLKTKPKTVLYNCLYYAAQFGFASIIRDYPKKVTRTRKGHNLLHIAIEHSQIECVKVLLSQENYKKCLNQQGQSGETPLHLAAKTGDYTVVQLLLSRGGNITATNESKQTPLFSAAQNGRSHAVDLLIKSGATVDHVDKYGRTALSYACENGHENVVQVLKNRADFKVFDKNGWTPLFHAAKNGREDVVRLLLDCDVDVNAFNKVGKSALLLAAENGHLKVVNLLVRRGADVNHSDAVFKWTSIFYAVKSGQEEMVKLLVQNGGDVNVVDQVGMKPLHYANGHRGIIKFLQKKGKHQ